MTEVLQANLFFFITAMAVVVFTILLCVALYFVIKILRTISRITDRVDESSEAIASDAKQLRDYLIGGGLVSQIVSLFIKGRQKGRRRGSSADED